MSAVTNDDARRRLNTKSHEWATREKQPWTGDEEVVILDRWVMIEPQDRDEEGISRELQRTYFACLGKAEQIRLLLGIEHHTTHRNTEPRYIGAMDDPEDRWWETT